MPSSPSALNLSQHQGLFQWVICSHQMTKYWSFRFSINPSSEHSGLISLKTVWFDLLAVHGTFGSLLQHHSSKASVLWCSPFFTVQLSQLHVTTRKTITLPVRTSVGRVISLLFNTLSRFVTAFLTRSSRLLITVETLNYQAWLLVSLEGCKWLRDRGAIKHDSWASCLEQQSG